MRFYLVAGELSGDVLGAGLIQALRRRFPDASFRGIGGPRMIAEGLDSLYPLETLSVMGLVEVLRHLPGLVRVRRHLRRDAREWGADAFIGIDAPDFNLGLERQLRREGMTTAHYVSPSVWAWRQGRIRKIARSVDLMLVFLPFEAGFYQRHGIPVAFVGHPLADDIPLEPDTGQARQALALSPDATLLALLPGSRRAEVANLLPLFLRAGRRLQQRRPGLRFVIPAASPERRTEIEHILSQQPLDGVTVVDGDAQRAMAAADVVVLASGTATLEAMLLKRPMVVAYRMSPLTFAIVRRLARISWVALPNLLAGRELVPELLQSDLTEDGLVREVEGWLDQPKRMEAVAQRFLEFHQQLRRDASQRAAEAIAGMLKP